MSNKGKLLRKISIISVIFLAFLAMFNITSNAASKKTTMTRKDIQDMVKTDEWYTFNPKDYIGQPVVDLNTANDDDEKYGYCIDSAHARGGNYRIVNIIDINNMVDAEGQAKVYGIPAKYKNGYKYTINLHKNLKPYIMVAYLSSIPKERDGSLWTNYTTIQEIFYNKFYVNKMKKVGLYKDFQATNNNSESDMLKYNSILKKASKFADDYIKSSSTSGYLEDNMTDAQKEKVEFKVIGSKTYIGPYTIKKTGSCNVERITVNGIGANKIIIANSIDGIEKKTEKDVNKTPNNKKFFIVVDAKLNKIDSVVLKGDKSKEILKGRLMVLAGGNAQDWVFYKADKSETPTELKLHAPKRKVGSIEITKKDELNADLNFKDVGFKLYNTNKGWVAQDSNGNIKYVAHFDDAKEYKTGANGKVTIQNLDAGSYKIFETSIPNELKKYYKIGTWNVPIFGTDEREERTAVAVKNSKGGYVHKVTDGSTVKATRTNTRAYSALQIKKVDSDDSKIKLTGIKFRLYKLGKDAGWVTVDNIALSNDGVMNYTGTVPDSEYDTNKKIAEFITINNLTPTIEKLPTGTYQVYEIDVGPYSDKYELGEFSVEGSSVSHKGDRKGEIAVGINKKGVVEFTAENTPVARKISIKGYVWLDVANGKNGTGRNNKYYEDKDEPDKTVVDKLMQGITVELVDTTTGKVEQITVTDANGAYRFDNVSTDKLANYIVRFVYDGYTYQDVISNYNQVEDLENTSKAVEDTTRTNLNNLFTELEGEGQKLSNGTLLEYNKSEENGVQLTEGTLEALPKVQANTGSGYLKKCYDKDTTVEVIENINLGLYKREMPNLTIQKDIDSAQISLNGYTYTYHYNKKLTGDSATETSLGVDFDGDYALPVYKADVEYNKANAGKGLEAVAIYKIKLQNSSTNLYTTVNEIREAFSRNYELIPGEVYLSDSNVFDTTAKKIGVTADITTNADRDPNSEYLHGTIHFNEPVKLGPVANVNGERTYGNTKYVYLKLRILDITTEYEKYAEGKTPDESRSNLKNIVEISRYSVYSDSNCKEIHAGVDRTSIPNNLELNTYTPKEDDNDKAPGLRIVDAGERKISGTVFEDEDADGKTGAGEERIGNGKLDDNETNRIKGVKVQLVNVANQNNPVLVEAETNEQGDFTLSGFIPGRYKIVYIWGDENGKYNVVDYKSTIYNKALIDWFANNPDKYSLAMDEWKTRQDIDAYELTNEGSKITKMNSSTNEFTVNIESKQSNEALGINLNSNDKKFDNAKFIFTANDTNFGIIERPRQALDIDKRIKSILVKTEAGQTIADATLLDNGELEVKTGKEYISGGSDLGYIWLQIDKSITQSMTAKIDYVITVANNSEVDYADEAYYKYGTAANNAVKMKLNATDIYDYMKGVNLSSETTTWETVTSGNYKIDTTDGQTITERDFMQQYSKHVNENGEVEEFEWINSITETKAIYTEWLENMPQKAVGTVRTVKLADRDIAKYVGTELTKELEPGQSVSAEIETSKLIANGDEIRFDNDAEIAEIEYSKDQRYGRKPSALTSKTYDRAGWISITPATGENRDYTAVIVTTVSAIAVLGIGIVFIKKKILK